MSKEDIARAFGEVADILELEEANPFRVRALPGFGIVSEQLLARRLQADMGREERFKLADVQTTARSLLAYLRDDPAVEAAELAGSFRRRKETVGDLDLVVASNAPERVAGRFLSLRGQGMEA